MSDGAESDSRRAWTRLAACTGAAALLQLDGTLITVALPAVAHGLGVSGASTSIVLGAYFAAYALMLLPGGVLVDRFGARRLAVAGLGLFAIGAAAGAISTGIGATRGDAGCARRRRRARQPRGSGRRRQRLPARAPGSRARRLGGERRHRQSSWPPHRRAVDGRLWLAGRLVGARPALAARDLGGDHASPGPHNGAVHWPSHRRRSPGSCLPPHSLPH